MFKQRQPRTDQTRASSANYELQLICSVQAAFAYIFVCVCVCVCLWIAQAIICLCTHAHIHTHTVSVRLFVYLDSHSKHFERSPCAQLANWFPCTHYSLLLTLFTNRHSFIHSAIRVLFILFTIRHSIDIKSMEKTYLGTRCGKRNFLIFRFQFTKTFSTFSPFSPFYLGFNAQLRVSLAQRYPAAAISVLRSVWGIA